jgi:glycosyltransferase involved in cell wall biosynthesis
VRRLALPRNQGKGSALRRGLREGNGRYLGFIDADGDLDPALWRSFTQLMKLYEPDAIVGDKSHPLAYTDFDASWTRNLCSIGYRLVVRALFPGLAVRDTQVGLKAFRREVLADVLARSVESRFVIDVELLALANRMGYRRILAAPVALYRVDRSTVTFRAVIQMFCDTVRLAWRLQIADGYRLANMRTKARTVREWGTIDAGVPRQWTQESTRPEIPEEVR